jgi:hypothetical protein
VRTTARQHTVAEHVTLISTPAKQVFPRVGNLQLSILLVDYVYLPEMGAHVFTQGWLGHSVRAGCGLMVKVLISANPSSLIWTKQDRRQATRILDYLLY